MARMHVQCVNSDLDREACRSSQEGKRACLSFLSLKLKLQNYIKSERISITVQTGSLGPNLSLWF